MSSRSNVQIDARHKNNTSTKTVHSESNTCSSKICSVSALNYIILPWCFFTASMSYVLAKSQKKTKHVYQWVNNLKSVKQWNLSLTTPLHIIGMSHSGLCSWFGWVLNSWNMQARLQLVCNYKILHSHINAWAFTLLSYILPSNWGPNLWPIVIGHMTDFIVRNKFRYITY